MPLLPGGCLNLLAREILSQLSALLFELGQLGIKLSDDLLHLLLLLRLQCIALLPLFCHALLKIPSTFSGFLQRDLSMVQGRLELTNLDLIAFLFFTEEIDLTLARLKLNVQSLILGPLFTEELILPIELFVCVRKLCLKVLNLA